VVRADFLARFFFLSAQGEILGRATGGEASRMDAQRERGVDWIPIDMGMTRRISACLQAVQEPVRRGSDRRTHSMPELARLVLAYTFNFWLKADG
jgi:hypothetical protein